MNLRNQMEALLKEKHIDLDIIYRIMLLIEEMSLLIFQDDGVLFDITETDNPISSMRSYVVSNIMSANYQKAHLTAVSYNLNVFIFPLA